MIIGGVGGVFRTGGSKTEYSETFIPVIIGNVSKSLDAEFNSIIPIIYDARVRIQNTDAEWIEITDVNYASIYFSNSGSSANITIKNTQEWSLTGDKNPLLLDTSLRPVEIYIAMTIRGTRLEKLVFIGVIENYSEVHGRSGSSINIVCRSIVKKLQNISVVANTRKTIYRKIYDAFIELPDYEAGKTLVFATNDNALLPDETTYSSFTEMIKSLLPESTLTSGVGVPLIILDRFISNADGDRYSYTDSNCSAITRSYGLGYNYIHYTYVDENWWYNSKLSQWRRNKDMSPGDKITGDWVKTPRTLKAAYINGSDIEKRGVYPTPFYVDATQNNAIKYSEESIQGKISIKTQLNVFVEIGTEIFIDSDVINQSVDARVNNITINYSSGTASMTMSDLAVSREKS